MTYVLLEQPYVLIPLLVVGTYFCLVVWLRRRTPQARRALLVALALLIVLPVVQRLVVTDREQIRAVSDAIASAADQGDVDGIIRLLSVDFRLQDMDREALREFAKSRLDRFHPKDTAISDFRAQVNGDQATVTFVSSCTIMGEYSGPVRIGWTAVFVRVDGVWRLQSADIREIPFSPVKSLDDLR